MNCKWIEDEDDGAWDTSCGKRFLITEGTPEENGMKFCCYCGKPLVSHTFEWRDE